MLGLTCLERWLNVEGIPGGIPPWCFDVHQSWHPTKHHPSGTAGITAGIPLSRQERGRSADISAQHLIRTLQQEPCRLVLCCQPCLWARWGQWVRKAGLFSGQPQAVQMADHPRVSPGGVRKGSGMEKQQPQRASNNCWWKEESWRCHDGSSAEF